MNGTLIAVPQINWNCALNMNVPAVQRISMKSKKLKAGAACSRESPSMTIGCIVASPNDYTSDVHGTAPMSALHLYPEFPTKPYLTISELERNQRFALIKGVGICPVGAEDAKLSKEFRNKHGGRDWTWVEQGFPDLRSYFWIDVSKSNGVTHHDEPYVIDGNAIKCPGMTFGLFRFDWSCSDQVFIEALRAWLDKNRDRTVKISDARGGGSESRQFRSLLNKLSAWRLLNFPMTWDEAASHTQAEREDHRSLYSEQPAWIQRGMRLIAFWECLTANGS